MISRFSPPDMRAVMVSMGKEAARFLLLTAIGLLVTFIFLGAGFWAAAQGAQSAKQSQEAR